MDRQPTWVKWLIGLIILGAVGVAAYLLATREDQPGAAYWEVDPATELDATTTAVPILVVELDCASGESADGRVEVSVRYGSDEVELEVSVHRRSDIEECPGNPITPYTVELDEPLGDRAIVGERPIGG